MKLHKIAIHSVPRSGSTWLGHLVNSSPHVIFKYQPLFSYALKNYLDEYSSAAQIDSFFEKLIETNDDFLDQKQDIQSGKVPRFEKSEIDAVVYKEVRYHHILPNLLETCKGLKLVALIRNPLSVISSWLAAPREFRKDLGWKEMEEWKDAKKKNSNKKQEFYGFEKWKEVTLLFEHLHQKYPNRVTIILYNDLLRNTFNITQKLFSKLELEFTAQTEDFIKMSHSVHINDPYAVYRTNQRDDNWKKQLNPKIAKSILDEVKGTPFEKYLM